LEEAINEEYIHSKKTLISRHFVFILLFSVSSFARQFILMGSLPFFEITINIKRIFFFATMPPIGAASSLVLI
jgi:hypothetical protein